MRLRFNKKNSYLLTAAAIVAVILASSLIPTARKPVLDFLKQPLKIVDFFQDEFLALIRFHVNAREVVALRRKNDFLNNKINAFNEATLENRRLKQLLVLKQNSVFKVIPSRVIARPPDNWSSAVVIDKGSRNGIRRGQAAISYLGLAGRIAETSLTTSKVILLTDPDSAVSAINQRSRQEGLVCGTLGANLIMKYIPDDSDVQVGDKILTSGLSGSSPKGILIGSVSSIGKDFSGLSLFAVLKPAVNLSCVEELLVIPE